MSSKTTLLKVFYSFSDVMTEARDRTKTSGVCHHAEPYSTNPSALAWVLVNETGNYLYSDGEMKQPTEAVAQDLAVRRDKRKRLSVDY